MYKNLFIVRHGNSPWSLNSISDFDRTIDEQGINDNLLMSEQLLGNNNLPDKIISSPAIRAYHSATIFAQRFKYLLSDIIINDEMYLADKNTVLDIIRQTEDNVQSLMLVGHNPTFTDLANYFLKDEIGNMPTSGVIGLKLKLDSWSKINKAKPIDSFFYHP